MIVITEKVAHPNCLFGCYLIKHEINIPDNIKGGRIRQIQSLDAFERRISGCDIPNHISVNERKVTRKYSKNYLGSDVFLKVVSHDNLWDFYEYIGYDKANRTKKYTNEFFKVTLFD